MKKTTLSLLVASCMASTPAFADCSITSTQNSTEKDTGSYAETFVHASRTFNRIGSTPLNIGYTCDAGEQVAVSIADADLNEIYRPTSNYGLDYVFRSAGQVFGNGSDAAPTFGANPFDFEIAFNRYDSTVIYPIVDQIVVNLVDSKDTSLIYDTATLQYRQTHPDDQCELTVRPTIYNFGNINLIDLINTYESGTSVGMAPNTRILEVEETLAIKCDPGVTTTIHPDMLTTSGYDSGIPNYPVFYVLMKPQGGSYTSSSVIGSDSPETVVADGNEHYYTVKLVMEEPAGGWETISENITFQIPWVVTSN
tara:strand:+ start:33067 stop:33996 length:930 start_codon:yes stop_codon:yes gene_type:complete